MCRLTSSYSHLTQRNNSPLSKQNSNHLNSHNVWKSLAYDVFIRFSCGLNFEQRICMTNWTHGKICVGKSFDSYLKFTKQCNCDRTFRQKGVGAKLVYDICQKYLMDIRAFYRIHSYKVHFGYIRKNLSKIYRENVQKNWHCHKYIKCNTMHFAKQRFTLLNTIALYSFSMIQWSCSHDRSDISEDVWRCSLSRLGRMCMCLCGIIVLMAFQKAREITTTITSAWFQTCSCVPVCL